jgi:hypothetical protein
MYHAATFAANRLAVKPGSRGFAQKLENDKNGEARAQLDGDLRLSRVLSFAILNAARVKT